MKRFIFKRNDALIIFTASKTSNKKIATPTETIVQTYSYSRGQFDAVAGKPTMAEFFSHDGAVCFDCPFSYSNGAKLSACYTHKVMQFSGFLSQLRSIAKTTTWDAIPELNETMAASIVDMCKGVYVRFGSYGEPSLIPVGLVDAITKVAKSWTGYTHQWMHKPEYAPYLMASVHTAIGERKAADMGFRSFIATTDRLNEYVNCPASNEAGFKSTCSKCGLCSGTSGKGKKSVYILQH